MSRSPTGPEQLIHMANDIAHFFATTDDRDAAVRGISDHVRRFWTPRMRRKLISEMNDGRSDERLEELPRQALHLLREYPGLEPGHWTEGGPSGGSDCG